VQREVTRPLKAKELTGGVSAVLSPGAVVSSSRIRPSSLSDLQEGAEPYMVEFVCVGRTYRCALVDFQPRTRILDPLPSGV
jgi:hypothetical protein